jgi:hypothetical protein
MAHAYYHAKSSARRFEGSQPCARERLLVSCVGCALRVFYLVEAPISAHLVVFLLIPGISTFASPFLQAKKAIAAKGGKHHGALHGSICLHR